MNSVFQNMRSASSGLYETALDITQQVRQLGFVRGLNNLYGLDGMENGVVPVLISALEILKRNSSERWDGWLEVLKQQRSLYRFTLFIPASFCLLQRPSVSHVLLAMNAFCESAQFMHQHAVYSFENYMQCSQKISQMPLFQSNLAQYCLKSPKHFFMLCARGWEIGLLAHRYYKYPNTAGIDPRQFVNLDMSQTLAKIGARKRKDLLEVTYYIGQIALIILKSGSKGSQNYWSRSFAVAFHLINFGTQSIGLIKLLIKDSLSTE